jgi:hypothetical protein
MLRPLPKGSGRRSGQAAFLLPDERQQEGLEVGNAILRAEMGGLPGPPLSISKRRQNR